MTGTVFISEDAGGRETITITLPCPPADRYFYDKWHSAAMARIDELWMDIWGMCDNTCDLSVESYLEQLGDA